MQVAERSTRGGLVLFAANTVSAGIAAVAVILIGRLLGPGNYGLFSLAVAVGGALQLLPGFGVNVAVTRYVAYHESLGEGDRALRLAKNAISFTVLTGLAVSLAGIALAGPIATYVLHRPSLTVEVELVSIMVLGQAFLTAGSGAAVGYNWIGLAGATNVVQAASRTVLSPLLIVVGLGLVGAVLGNAVSFLIAGAFCVVVLYAYRLRKRVGSLSSFGGDVREMVGYGAPLFVGSTLSSVALSYYVPFVLAAIVSNETLGYYQAASVISIPISILTGAAATVLLPAFASLDGERRDTLAAVRKSTLYVAYFALPLILLTVSGAKQLVELLFSTPYLPAVPYVEYLALASVPVMLGWTVLPTYFNGVGRTRLTMVTVGGGAVVLFALAPLLAISAGMGVDGAILALLVSSFVTTVLAVYFLRERFAGSLDYGPLAATAVGGVLSFLAVLLLPAFKSEIAALIAKPVVFGLVYLATTPLLGAIGGDDVQIVQASLRRMRFVRDIASPFIKYVSVFVSLRARIIGSDASPSSAPRRG